jgi:hypothetical protein
MMNNNPQGGFTVLETLVAMGALSLIMSVLALSLSSSAGAMQKAQDSALFGIKLLSADSLIRNRLGAVAVPYWETPIMEAEESSVTIPWYQGEKEGYVRLLVEDGALIMETAGKGKTERALLISGLDRIELSVLRNAGNVPYGVGVAYLRGQNSYHTLAAFASVPVERGNAGGFPSRGGFPSLGGLPSRGGRP